MKVADAEQMRRLDREAMEGYGIPGIVLMENAALGVVRAMERRYGPAKGRSFAVFCGKGNNGGDGMAVARHLNNRGARVRVFLAGEPRELKGDAAVNYGICERMGIPVAGLQDSRHLRGVSSHLKRSDVVVDALLGTGMTPPVRGLTAALVGRINRSGRPVVAVDLPTGLCADSSEVSGEVVRADLTVTFGLPKLSLVQYPSLSLAGQVEVADISLPAVLVEKAEIPVELLEAGRLPPLPVRRQDMHKGEAGRVLLVAGSRGMPGAAVMAALACFRIGAGLVYAALPGSVQAAFQRRLMEGILVPLEESEGDCLTPASLPGILRAVRGKKVVAAGPGIGLDPATGEMLRSLILKSRVPLILDADGLTHLAEDPEVLKGAKAPVILTPHPGEMARLSGASAERLQTRRVDAAREFAGAFGVILVLKGARTVVADPAGRAWINPTGNPGMATAGAGDVLTGMIAGLLAQGMVPLHAALAGVYLHGRCGDRAATRRGARGLLSRDMIREIPAVLKEQGI